jgi:Tol biopolymer transport system component
MKTKLFLRLTVFFLLASSIVTGQEISKRMLHKNQRFEVMGESTAEIVQVLPGEKIIEKTTLDNKATLFFTDKNGKQTKIYDGNLVDHFSHSQAGERLCFQAGGEFIVKDVNTLQEFRYQTLDPIYLSSFATISRDGNEITFHKSARLSKEGETINDGVIMVRNVITQEERVIGNGGWPRWSSNSSQIAFSRVEGSIGDWTNYLWVVNSDGTETRKLESAIHMGGAHVKWSSDGKYVMDSDREENLRIVNVLKDESVVVPVSRLGKIPNARKYFGKTAWSPDSKTILAQVFVDKDITEENIGIELFLISVDGAKIEKIDIPGLNKDFPIWLNSSELLFRNSQQGNLWNKTIVRSAE